jgi:hypothetical protein
MPSAHFDTVILCYVWIFYAIQLKPSKKETFTGSVRSIRPSDCLHLSSLSLRLYRFLSSLPFHL